MIMHFKEIFALFVGLSSYGFAFFLLIKKRISNKVAIILFCVSIFAGLAIHNCDVIRNFKLWGLEVETFQKEVSIIENNAINRINEEVNNQKNSIALITRDANNARQDIEAIKDSSEKKLKKIEDLLNNSLKTSEELNDLKDFLLTYLKALNDDSDAFERLGTWGCDTSYRFNKISFDMYETIRLIHKEKAIIGIAYRDIQWKENVDVSKFSFSDFIKFIDSEDWKYHTGIIDILWKREDIGDKEKMSFLIDVLKKRLIRKECG